MLCEIKDERQQKVLSGEFETVIVEVTQGGHGVEGNPYERLTNLIITPVKASSTDHDWQQAAKVFLRLDEDAATFLAEALIKVSSGQEMGLVHTAHPVPAGQEAGESEKGGGSRHRWTSKRH